MPEFCFWGHASQNILEGLGEYTNFPSWQSIIKIWIMFYTFPCHHRCSSLEMLYEDSYRKVMPWPTKPHDWGWVLVVGCTYVWLVCEVTEAGRLTYTQLMTMAATTPHTSHHWLAQSLWQQEATIKHNENVLIKKHTYYFWALWVIKH